MSSMQKLKNTQRKLILYNIWHGFSLRSWWPGVLLISCHVVISKQQPDQDTRVQPVYNRKETTWREPRDQI